MSAVDRFCRSCGEINVTEPADRGQERGGEAAAEGYRIRPLDSPAVDPAGGERWDPPKETPSVEVVPWQAWCASAEAQCLGEETAYQSAILMVLRAHHVSDKEKEQQVDVCVEGKRRHVFVRAAQDFEAEQMRLFPGAPKTKGFLRHSEHPHRATFKVWAKAVEKEGGADKMREFYLNPEFKLPDIKTGASAVAEASGASAANGGGVAAGAEVAARQEWSWTGEESLYPYWAVTRLTKADMRKLQAEQDVATARFNMVANHDEVANVTVGAGHNLTCIVSVPVLRNAVALRKGETLYMEVVPKEKAMQTKRKAETWRTGAVPKQASKAAMG